MTAGAVESVLAVTPTERIKTALSVFFAIYEGLELTDPATELTMRKGLANSSRAYMQFKCLSKGVVLLSFIVALFPQ
jgi:hypothetical protein